MPEVPFHRPSIGQEEIDEVVSTMIGLVDDWPSSPTAV